MKTWKNKISDHITYAEATKSSTAIKYDIKNEPTEEQLKNMKSVAENVFEKVREYFGVPIAVTSFFRSEELNKKVGGSRTSQHVKGEAMDIDADVFGMVSNRAIFNYIKENLIFDQLIWEFGTDKDPAWIHVSYSDTNNRGIIMKASKESTMFGKKTKYEYIKK